jgi:hypothetical protein
MSETPEKQPEFPVASQWRDTNPQKKDATGKILFLIAGGLLLSIMVSCACGPVR